VRVGDLVKMDHGIWKEDVWGVGMVVEVCSRTPNDVCVYWSKIGPSWEMITTLDVVQ